MCGNYVDTVAQGVWSKIARAVCRETEINVLICRFRFANNLKCQQQHMSLHRKLECFTDRRY